MSYVSSHAQKGLGATLEIQTASSPLTYLKVGEVFSLDQNGYENETDDVTNFQSTAREFVGTILNPGTWDLSMNRVGTDVGQVEMHVALEDASTRNFRITLPVNVNDGQSVTGDTATFKAIVQKYPLSVKADKAIKITASLKVSGKVTITPGS